MRARAMRFENSAAYAFGIDSFDLDDLGGGGKTAYDAHRRWRNGNEFREETDDRLVCLAVHGRRRDAHLPDISEPPGELGPGCASADFKSDASLHETPHAPFRICASRCAPVNR